MLLTFFPNTCRKVLFAHFSSLIMQHFPTTLHKPMYTCKRLNVHVHNTGRAWESSQTCGDCPCNNRIRTLCRTIWELSQSQLCTKHIRNSFCCWTAWFSSKPSTCNKKNDSRTSTNTRFIASQFITACNAAHVAGCDELTSNVYVFWVCGQTIHAKHSEYVNRNHKKLLDENNLCTGGPFCGHSSPVVPCTPPQTKKGRCPVADLLFVIY